MEKTINLGGKEYKLRSSLFTIISYRSTFGTELFSDVKVLDKLKDKDEDEISKIIDTIFRITYILHKPYTKQSYDEFLNDFDFSIIGDVKALEELANRKAAVVINKHRSITLEPMSPYERRIIHTALQNHPKVKTSSSGEEPYRKITISLK